MRKICSGFSADQDRGLCRQYADSMARNVEGMIATHTPTEICNQKCPACSDTKRNKGRYHGCDSCVVATTGMKFLTQQYGFNHVNLSYIEFKCLKFQRIFIQFLKNRINWSIMFATFAVAFREPTKGHFAYNMPTILSDILNKCCLLIRQVKFAMQSVQLAQGREIMIRRINQANLMHVIHVLWPPLPSNY
jgi:hypothetical protein